MSPNPSTHGPRRVTGGYCIAHTVTQKYLRWWVISGNVECMSEQVRPPFAYFGGKTKLATRIAELLPEHEHYVEPFAGGLSVLLAKEPSKAETVNDIDGDLVNFWRVLRDQPEDLERAAILTPHSREEYEISRDLEGLTDLERARRVWVRLTQGRSNSMQPHGWRYGRDISKVRANHGKAFTRRMPPAAERISNVTLENRDALELVRDYGTEPSVCIYADPPYLGSTRGTNYRHEMLEDDLHIQLAEALAGCKSSVVLSGYASPLYEEMYSGWHRMELKAPKSLSNGAAENEVLWSNVQLGIQEAFDFGEAS